MTGVNPTTLLCPPDFFPFFCRPRWSSRGPRPAVNAASPPNALMHWYWYAPLCHARDLSKPGSASARSVRRTGSASLTAL